MKATGHVRRIDELGRVVLPAELRQSLGIADKDELEIYVEGETIVLVKYLPRCVFCGRCEGLREFKGKMVCMECQKVAHGERAW
ncbi:MAG: AbrB/MazE/SpoVT family DNA-binding domain-containing protein [Sulfobacillus sp.]